MILFEKVDFSFHYNSYFKSMEIYLDLLIRAANRATLENGSTASVKIVMVDFKKSIEMLKNDKHSE